MLSFAPTASLFLAGIIQASALTLPPPTGPYNTTLASFKLTDKLRLDPYAPTKTPRALMISVFNPVPASQCSALLTPYMDPITAEFKDAAYAPLGIPAGTFGSINMQTCRSSSRNAKAYPIVLFSTGGGNPRLTYAIMAQQVASAGYTVITIDHPYDADIVTFPDNSTVLGIDVETDIDFAVNVRAKDVSFVLDQLSVPSISNKLFPGVGCDLDVSKVAMFGHSLGGATAAQVMLTDKRIVGGVNLDGTFFSTVVQKGLKRPFMIFSHEGKNLTTDESWTATWSVLTGWKRQFELRGSAHGTFTDFPALINALGFEGMLGDAGTELIGTIGGVRSLEIITSYVQAFMAFMLKGKKSALLDGKNGTYPEVSLGASS
ncbi:PAF acetylhydrolase family protein [Rhexocercosporidium sp. MPI-PUGE-AT-0058]|nr:PAF acetylhydrolase family protein [Rhexocercosporidium sp. MPI-PUGE-AT-0058]